MPTPSRTSTAQIVAAGRVILEAEGFEGLTMQRVAAAVGVRAPSLYKRVDGRRELVRLIADRRRGGPVASARGGGNDRRPATGPGRDRDGVPCLRARASRGVCAAVPPPAGGLDARRRPRLARVRRAVQDGRGDLRARGAAARGGPDGRRLGERVRRDGAGGRIPPRRGRRPRLRLRRRADRGGDQRAAASRATMSGMQTTALIADARRGSSARPQSSRIRELRAGYEVDWTGRYRGEASAVVRPGSVEEVAEIVRACRAARVPLVPQGGNTGLVGGGIPRDGAVLLSLRRLTTIEDVDPDSGTVVAGAGATVAAVHRPQPRRDGRMAWTSPPATRRPSAARSRPTPVGSTCSATA